MGTAMIRKSRLLSGRGKKRLKIEILTPTPLENHWRWGKKEDWFYPLKISWTNLLRKTRGRSWACSWEAEISKITWKQIIQTMTGHKSNSNLNPLIRLKEIFVLFCFFFNYFCPKEVKREKCVKQWDLLVRTGVEMSIPPRDWR